MTGSSDEEELPRTKHFRLVLVIVLVVVVITGFFAAAYTFHFFAPGKTNCWAPPTNLRWVPAIVVM